MPSAAATRRALAQHISRHTKRLLTSQLALALGESQLWQWTIDGKSQERVTDQKTIDAYFRGETRPGTVFLRVKDGDNRAIDSLLDRAYGRPAPTDDQNTRPSVVVIVGSGAAAIGPSPWDVTSNTVMVTSTTVTPNDVAVTSNAVTHRPTPPSDRGLSPPTGDRIRPGAPRRSRP